MKKLFSALCLLFVGTALAVADPNARVDSPGWEGTITKVSSSSVTVHWGNVKTAQINEQEPATGDSREYTFTVTPSTVITVHGNKASKRSPIGSNARWIGASSPISRMSEKSAVSPA
jgi:hypothetical protein